MSEAKRKAVSVLPFTVEARTPRNGDVIVQSLGQLKLRGAVSAAVEVFDRQWTDPDAEPDELQTRPVGAKLIDGVGELPGVRLSVDPGTLSWETSDPLRGDERKLESIRKALVLACGVASVDQKLVGERSRSGTVDENVMKTLCRELLCFVEAGEMRIVRGVAPSREDVDELPGRYLLNWSNEGQWHQPRFEDQYEGWVNDMSRMT